MRTTPTKSEITAFLDKLQKRIKATEKAQAKAATVRADAQKFEDTIEEIGEPDYRDDKNINLLAVTQLKLNSCLKVLEAEETKLGAEVVELGELITPGGELCALALQEVASNRLETVTATLALFSTSWERAREVARQTDACRASHGSLSRFFQMRSPVREYTGYYGGEEETLEQHQVDASALADNVLLDARLIESVLEAASSRSGDLMKFLPFTSAASQGKAPANINEPAVAQPEANDLPESNE